MIQFLRSLFLLRFLRVFLFSNELRRLLRCKVRCFGSWWMFLMCLRHRSNRSLNLCGILLVLFFMIVILCACLIYLLRGFSQSVLEQLTVEIRIFSWPFSLLGRLRLCPCFIFTFLLQSLGLRLFNVGSQYGLNLLDNPIGGFHDLPGLSLFFKQT